MVTNMGKQHKALQEYHMKKKVLGIVQEEMDNERMKVFNFALDSIMNVMAISLHDTYGFGSKRIGEVVKKIENHFDCFQQGLVSYDELVELSKSIYKKDK
jgi:hypothetical protein